MDSNHFLKEAWEKEYSKKGIPSSFRKDPSEPVVKFVNWLKHKKNDGILAADIGCGLGRNSFYLASQGFKVIGLELLEKNVNTINKESKLNNLDVQAISQDVTSNWPMAVHSQDIVIDIFCYKHIVDKQKQAKYRKELSRVLKSSGFYFISLASENDGFYGPLLKDLPTNKEKLVVDPQSRISSFVYSIQSLAEEFSDFFEAIEIKEETSQSPMYGKEYTQRVINAILKKTN